MVAVSLAIGLQLALNALLGDLFPFMTMFLAVLIVAGYGGRGPAMVAVILGAAASAFFLLRPRFSFSVSGFENQAGLFIYMIVGAGIAQLGGALRLAKERCEQSAEEASREREQFRTILNSMGEAVISTDGAGRVSFLNSAAEETTGWPLAQATGKPLTDVLRTLDEVSRLPVAMSVSSRLRSDANGTNSDHAIVVSQDGTERVIESRTGRIPLGSASDAGSVLVYRDVSQRRAVERQLVRSEQLLRLFVEHTPVAVAMFDREMRYLLASRRWLADFALGESNLRGKCQYDVMPQVSDRWKEVHRRCLAGAIEREEAERYVSPGGNEEWLRWETRPWRDESGDIGGIIIVSEVVTAEQRNRQALEQQANTLSGILDATVDNIYVIDDAGQYTYASTGGARAIGYEPADVAGKGWRELGLPSETMQQFDHQREQVLNSGKPSQHEMRFLMPDGTTRDFEYTISPVAGDNGPRRAVVVVSRDMTRHKAAEQERSELLLQLEKQNAFMSAVLRQVPAAIVVADAATGRLVISNEESHRIVQHEYHAGRRLEEYGNDFILEAFRPDGTRYQSGEWPLDRALLGETVVREEIELVRRDRTRVTIRVNAGPIHVGDKVVAAVVAFHDITDRKKVEQTATFVASASAAIAGLEDYEETLERIARLAVPDFADIAAVDIANGDGTTRRAAAAHVDPSKAELVLELHRRFPPAKDSFFGYMNVLRIGQSELIAEITDAMLAESSYCEEQLDLLRRLVPKSLLCVPIRSRGELAGLMTFVTAESGRRYDEHDLAVAEDLAARAAIAIENAKLYTELKAADRIKNEFLATLAHELRNPLAPIRNALHLMKEPFIDAADNEAVRAMAERQVIHLTRLIDDLMDVARITRGKIELHKTEVNLATVVNQAIETSRQQIVDRGHLLNVLLPHEPIRLEADPTRLEQILWNLLNNAAKYSDRGGRIDLVVERIGADVMIRVKDTGIGISPEMLAEIFGMFVQVGAHKEHARGGLGIGLSLVRTLVEMHGGTISAHSDGPGTGSEFIVRLPTLSNAPATEENTRNLSPAPVSRLACRRIMVIDDNVDGAKSLAKLLEFKHGQNVFVAHNGQTALDVADSYLPDVMLLDIGLPDINGYEVAKAIRQRPWGSKVIIFALTGWGQEADRRRSREAGIDHHLVKPLDPAHLEKLLSEMSRGTGDGRGNPKR